jgi:hypothetical protein
MGYAAQPFAIEIQKLKDVFGSKDQALLEKAKKTRMHDVYADQEQTGLYDKCLEDIIFHYIKPEDRPENKKQFNGLEESGHEYGYALMAISEVLGVFLAEEGDIFYTGRVFDQTNEFLKEKGFTITMERFWDAEYLFDIPRIEDFPVISSFTKKEVRYLYEELLKLHIDESKTDPDSDTYDEQEALLEFFRDKLEICINHDVEWLAFVH